MKIFKKINFLVFVFVIVLLSQSIEYGNTAEKREVIFKTDYTQDWSSRDGNNQNLRPVRDIKLPLKLGWRSKSEDNFSVISGNVLYRTKSFGNVISFGGRFFDTGKGAGGADIATKSYNLRDDSHLVVEDERAYFVMTGRDKDIIHSLVYAYNMKEKKILWEKELNWDYEGHFPWAKFKYDQPIMDGDYWNTDIKVEGDKVIVWMDAKEKGAKIYCYDKATGRELWKVGEEIKGRFEKNHFAISDNKIFCLSSTFKDMKDSQITALDLESGKVLWQKDTKGEVVLREGILAYKDKIHVVTSDNIYIINIQTGDIYKKINKNDFKAGSIEGLSLTDGNLFYVMINQNVANSGVACYKENGEIVWQLNGIFLPKLLFLTKDEIYVSGDFKIIYIIDRYTGEKKAMLVLGKNNEQDAVIDAIPYRDMVFVLKQNGYIYAYKEYKGDVEKAIKEKQAKRDRWKFWKKKK